LVLRYHDNYVEATLTPTFAPLSEDIPGIYEKFVPAERAHYYSDRDVFEETIDERGVYTSNVIRDYSLREIFENQFNIFREVPFILTK